MNPNTNKWALDLSDTLNHEGDSEIAQRVAFDYGYRWARNGNKIFYVAGAKYLIFDPETKFITWACFPPGDVYKIIWSFNEMLKLFKDPPKNIIYFKGLTLYKDGSVLTTAHGLNPMSSKDFEKALEIRKSMMNS